MCIAQAACTGKFARARGRNRAIIATGSDYIYALYSILSIYICVYVYIYIYMYV